MVGTEAGVSVLDSAPRRRRSVAERRRVVEETLEPCASVARVARKYGVNANQVFQWRRLYRTGRLAPVATELKLLPVSVEEPEQAACAISVEGPVHGGSINIELPGRAVISLEGPVDVRESSSALIANRNNAKLGTTDRPELVQLARRRLISEYMRLQPNQAAL